MRYYIAALFVTVLLIVPWFAYNYPIELDNLAQNIVTQLNQIAAVIVHKPKTVAGLQSTYNKIAFEPTVAKKAQKIRILVVPGHEPNYGGAEYGSVKEREMTVELAQYLQEFLQNNNHYQVFVTRDDMGWDPIFDNYFKKYWDDIEPWFKAHKNEMAEMIRVGQLEPGTPSVFHANAPQNVALRLYGIDKWSNENDIDIMVHVHFNDYPRRDHTTPGKYNGFAIYIPEHYYGNSSTTAAMAQKVFNRLAKYNPVSSLPGEKSGIVPDQDLIAVGSYNSVNAASMLIEYGYIYEPQFTNPALRSTAIKDLAYQTYLGLEDFFDPTNVTALSFAYDTLILPRDWSQSKLSSSTDVYALQTALMVRGFYPPAQKNLSECPRTGKSGPCTEGAIKQFQKEKNITGEENKIGPKTIEALNREFGASGASL